MNQFYQITSNHFKPISFNNEMVYLQYDSLRGLIERNFKSEYHEILAKPFVSGNNINWYSLQNTKFSPLDFFSKADKTTALIKYNQFVDEVQVFANTLKESADIDKITWGNLLGQAFNRNNNIVFSDGKDIVLLWGWNFNAEDENYIPPELYKIRVPQDEEGPQLTSDNELLEKSPAIKIDAVILENTPYAVNNLYDKKIIVRSNKKSRGIGNYLARGWWVLLLILLFLAALFYFLKPINCCNTNSNIYSTPNSDLPSLNFPVTRPGIDKTKIIPDPLGGGYIVSNLLNIALKEKNKSFISFANDLKSFYPDSNYKIIYFDTTVSRLQLLFPDNLRPTIKDEIKSKLNNYSLLIWDESIFQTSKVFNDPAFSNRRANWYFSAVKANEAWNITTGNDKIVVAVIDCGFDLNQPDLKKHIFHPYNVITKDSNVFATSTLYHGTHVAGIALANSNNGIGTSGIAPGCSFMPIQISGNDGAFSSSDVIDGLLYAIKHNANVINLSLGKQILEQLKNSSIQNQETFINTSLKDEEYFWEELFAYAEKQNITIIIASGNDNSMVGLDPMQRSESVIKVSSIDSSFKKAPYSNFGQESTICAPGTSIFSCLPNNKFGFLDGTSMAAPIVTGAVALMKSVNPNLKNIDIIRILKNTSKPLVDQNIGSLIQIDKAVMSAASFRN